MTRERLVPAFRFPDCRGSRNFAPIWVSVTPTVRLQPLELVYLRAGARSFLIYILLICPLCVLSFKMDLPWKRIFVGALTGTAALTQLASTLSGYKTPISPISVLFVLLLTLLILVFTWKAILYPKLFSSIRHIPGPSVSRKLCPTPEQISLIGSQGRLLS